WSTRKIVTWHLLADHRLTPRQKIACKRGAGARTLSVNTTQNWCLRHEIASWRFLYFSALAVSAGNVFHRPEAFQLSSLSGTALGCATFWADSPYRFVADLPPVFHPAMTGALWSFTPFGAG